MKKGLQDYKKNPKNDKRSSKLISKLFKTFLKTILVTFTIHWRAFWLVLKKSHSQIFLGKKMPIFLIFFRSFDSSYWMNVFWCKFWRWPLDGWISCWLLSWPHSHAILGNLKILLNLLNPRNLLWNHWDFWDYDNFLLLRLGHNSDLSRLKCAYNESSFYSYQPKSVKKIN